MVKIPLPITIRFATIADAGQLDHMIHESYREAGGWTTEKGLVMGKRIDVDQLRVLLADENTMENEPVLVAELIATNSDVKGVGGGNMIVGCIQLSKGTHGSRSAHSVGEEKLVDVEVLHTETIPVGDSTLAVSGATVADEVTLVPAMQGVMQSTLPSPPTVSGGSAMIGLFAVLPPYQSHGIGRLLFNAALNHIKEIWNCNKCIIWVLESRKELLIWYAKLGFVWNGEMRPFVYPEFLVQKVDFKVLEKVL